MDRAFGRPGAVFKLAPPTPGQSGWTRTTLYTFQGAADGRVPNGRLAFDAAGALYGATEDGGALGKGTLFKLTPPAPSSTTWVKDTLYEFAGGSDGERPVGNLVFDTEGALYGVGHGLNFGWTIFRLTPPAPGQTQWNKSTIRNSKRNLFPSLRFGAGGELYGGTKDGGEFFAGEIFQLKPIDSARTRWSQTTLHSFDRNGNGGWDPLDPFIIDESGAIYGTTATRGNGAVGAPGVVFKLSPPAPGSANWTKSNISIGFVEGRYYNYIGLLGFDPQGALYGWSTDNGRPKILKFTQRNPPGSIWASTVAFTAPFFLDAYGPPYFSGGPALSKGRAEFYLVGQDFQQIGRIARLSLAAPPTLKAKSKLYDFRAGADGEDPSGGVVMDLSGAVYGTTAHGGGATDAGLVFKLAPPVEGQIQWVQRALHRFNGADGKNPFRNLVFGANGALYGTTYSGGAGDLGTVFKLAPPTPPGREWTRETLYSFTGGDDGARPFSGLAADTYGALYGTTRYGGGAANAGTVFKLTPPRPPATRWSQTVLYRFQGGVDGAGPYAGVVFGRDNALYGATGSGGAGSAGTIFRLTPPAPTQTQWTKSTLYSFTGGADGSNPFADLTTDTQGALYGGTLSGGISGSGAVFRLNPPTAGGDWTISVLYRFTGDFNGAKPNGKLVFGYGGALLGATSAGGFAGAGTIFRLNPPAPGQTQWTKTTLYSFAGGSEGANPAGGLALDAWGALLGVTSFGGTANAGTVFKLQ